MLALLTTSNISHSTFIAFKPVLTATAAVYVARRMEYLESVTNVLHMER
jgi:hypothetical protein